MTWIGAYVLLLFYRYILCDRLHRENSCMRFACTQPHDHGFCLHFKFDDALLIHILYIILYTNIFSCVSHRSWRDAVACIVGVYTFEESELIISFINECINESHTHTYRYNTHCIQYLYTQVRECHLCNILLRRIHAVRRFTRNYAALNHCEKHVQYKERCCLRLNNIIFFEAQI